MTPEPQIEDYLTEDLRTIHEQIAAVSREIEMRLHYWIVAGLLTLSLASCGESAEEKAKREAEQRKAEKQIEDMLAVLATLKWVRDHDEVLREVRRQTKNQREGIQKDS